MRRSNGHRPWSKLYGHSSDRAIGRGELSPSVDREIAADLIAAPLYRRVAVLGGRSGRNHITCLARMLTAALQASA
ncbi:TetR family transcriptional regulator [Nitrospirillum viridazoti Y2]|nr:TetR family transcriptional regulator [Nitrospirillum amazonense Y2]